MVSGVERARQKARAEEHRQAMANEKMPFNERRGGPRPVPRRSAGDVETFSREVKGSFSRFPAVQQPQWHMFSL